MKKKIIKICSIFAVTVLGIYFLFTGIDNLKKYNRQMEMNKNKEINMVFTSDIGYLDYTKVAIKSAIVNKNKDSIYNINVLCVDLPEKQCKSFEKFKTENVNIYTKPLKLESISHIGNYKMDHYVTRADLFKFLMPDIFPELNKILYIDSDVIIMKDLSELYNNDVTDYYLGAVRKYISPLFKINLFENNSFLLIFKMEITHYNCGVLLFNLDKLRQDNIKEKLIEAKNKDTVRKLQTQQSFNDVIPYATTKHLSPIYNALSRWEDMDFYLLKFRELYKPFLDKTYSMGDLYNDAVIIHFAGGNKPWSCSDVRFFDEWWQYAKMVNPKWKFGDFGVKEYVY